MKLQNSKAKVLLCAVLTVTMIVTVMLPSISLSPQAQEVLNTSVYETSCFTEEEMTDNFEQWSSSSGFVDYTGDKATVADGVLSVTGGTAGNTRYSAHFYKAESLNQTVSATFGMDSSNPAATAVMWLRAGSYYRTANKDFVPTGYYLSASRAGGYCGVSLYKAHENASGTYALTQLGQIASSINAYSSYQNAYLDITVEATAVYDTKSKTTVISVYVYKGTSVLYSAAFEDNESELQDAGKVGIAVNSNADLTVPFKNFKYHSTDNSDVCGFITETSAKTDGTMAGLYTAIDPTATYEFSALVDASATEDGTFNNEPLSLMYKNSSNQYTQMILLTATEGVKVDGKYKKYTYAITLPENYVTENGTYTGTASSKKPMTLVFAGFTMKDATINNIKYANFELRKVNANGTRGGNLLCNGDFKMGTYGWSENIVPGLWQVTPQGFDQTVMGTQSRVKFQRAANKYDFWKNFVQSSFSPGELNLDKKTNICDLVCYGELSEYSIFADIDKNGVLDYSDEKMIKDSILNLQTIFENGEQKISEIDLLANAKKTQVLNATSLLPTADAEVYYVSEDGDDQNAGTKDAPWKTISKVNDAVASKNTDTKYFICFNRGDTFMGQLVASSNVTYTAYGTGAKPVITVSAQNIADTQKWTLIDKENNIYRYEDEITDIGSIFFNGGESYAAKRTPDIIKDSNGNYSYSFGYEALEDMQFISLPNPETAVTLNNSNASKIKGYTYLKCDSGNPAEIYESIQFNSREYIIQLKTGAKNITVDNLAVKFGGAHGIGGGDITNLLVQNCEIAFIGGGIMQYSEKYNYDGTFTYIASRYGNGVELHAACDGYTVKNCYIHDIYDTGITHQTGSNHSVPLVFKDVSYVNNLIENCVYSVEYFAIPGVEENATMIMDNILISENIMRNAGGGFGATRTLQETVWNMSTHIMGWAAHENRLAENSSFIISNNIFDRVVYSAPSRTQRINSSMVLVGAGDEEWLPVFSGNTYVNYLHNAFSYYGTNVPNTKFTAGYISKYSLVVDVDEILGDESGQVFFIK